MRFVYADSHILNVNVSPLGCRLADNGDHSVLTPQSVLAPLEAALGHDETPKP